MRQLGLKEGENHQPKLQQKENQNEASSKTLPQEFKVKYLGKKEATGLWGIRHTRRPVDEMVNEAKKMAKGKTLPLLNLLVSEKGVSITEMPENVNKNFVGGFHPIEVISYGVQDLVYTRVFAMIVVKEEAKTNPTIHPFHCHSFVCESRNSARKLTFALAEAFQQFSKKVKNNNALKPKKFAIDLRTAEEIEADLKDSEA
ncbi:hypothetical protein Anas_04116 [Armadillidium nasatum]|uniref:PID domain-containing protein n=1 Tax=Armadillidium nasatum TaxID=96803 RepID=A0A5N5TCD2_9CRUS|nr:hypothetical protein Anas_04116 [Armadillidium nasatum]